MTAPYNNGASNPQSVPCPMGINCPTGARTHAIGSSVLEEHKRLASSSRRPGATVSEIGSNRTSMVQMVSASLRGQGADRPVKVGAEDPEVVEERVRSLVPWATGDLSDPDDVREVAMEVFREGVEAELLRRLPRCDVEDPVMRDSNIQAMAMDLSSSLSLDSDNILPNATTDGYWTRFAANSKVDIYGRSWQSAKSLTSTLLANEWSAAADMKLSNSSSGVPYGETPEDYISSINNELYQVIEEEINDVLLDWPNIIMETTGRPPLSDAPTVEGMRPLDMSPQSPKISVPDVKPWKPVGSTSPMNASEASRFLMDIEKQDRNAEVEPDIQDYAMRSKFDAFLGDMNSAIQQEGVAGTLHGAYVYHAPANRSGAHNERDARRDKFARITNHRVDESARAYENMHVEQSRRVAGQQAAEMATPARGAESNVESKPRRVSLHRTNAGKVSVRHDDARQDAQRTPQNQRSLVDSVIGQMRENQERYDRSQARKADRIIIENEKRRQRSRWFN